MTEVLPRTEIELALKDLDGWSLEGNQIVKEYTFPKFRDAMAFIVRLSYEAEELEHHPEIRNMYNWVRIAITTVDAESQITHRDLAMARRIESLVEQGNQR